MIWQLPCLPSIAMHVTHVDMISRQSLSEVTRIIVNVTLSNRGVLDPSTERVGTEVSTVWQRCRCHQLCAVTMHETSHGTRAWIYSQDRHELVSRVGDALHRIYHNVYTEVVHRLLVQRRCQLYPDLIIHTQSQIGLLKVFTHIRLYRCQWFYYIWSLNRRYQK